MFPQLSGDVCSRLLPDVGEAAVLDRIVHQARRLALQGESVRKALSNPE